MRIEGILDKIHVYHPQADVEPLMRAYIFAAKAHKGQERISGEPYLSHPLEVAGILTELRLDTGTVAAGLLHDVVEDTHSTLTEIKELFGNEVAPRMPRGCWKTTRFLSYECGPVCSRAPN